MPFKRSVKIGEGEQGGMIWVLLSDINPCKPCVLIHIYVWLCGINSVAHTPLFRQ